MSYYFSQTSRKRMAGVHPKLIQVAETAIGYGLLDFTVLPDGGVRNLKTQKELVAKGVSKTLKSKHLIQNDGYGHALDLAPFPVDWKDIDRFVFLSKLMKQAAKEHGVRIQWGGDWKWKDYPHYELIT